MNTPDPSSATRPSVLILGANGRFGCAAAQAFDAAGWRVLAQVRRTPAAGLPAAARPLRIPLTDTAALCEAARHASVVVHAVNPLYTRWDAEALPALRAGLDVAERLGAHFMLPGNVYNFGAAMPAVLREDTPQRPSTRKGEIRAEMERLMAQRAAAGRFTASVVRAGDFFGAGRGNWFDQAIVKSLRAGKLVYPGPLDLPHAWAYLPDLARAFVRVAQQPDRPAFACWHFEGHTLTGAQLLSAIEAAAATLGIAPPRGFRRGGMPWGVIRVIGAVVPTWRELARMSYLWRVPHALDGRRLAALPGPALAVTPIEVAVRESLIALDFAAPHPTPSRRRFGLGTLLIADALLSFAPVAILGAAIGWPASLNQPAAAQLAAIAAKPGAVALGYGVYLLYSILVAPVMIGLAARVFGGLGQPLGATVAAFGALSALARAIGILRWLTVMPVLASAHAGADPALRQQLEWLFTAITQYGGGIGEVLGLSVFMAASVGTLAVGALLRGGLPRWLAGWGLVCALLLGGLALPALGGAALVPVAVAVSLLSVWMFAVGMWAMRQRA